MNIKIKQTKTEENEKNMKKKSKKHMQNVGM